jgi:predicted ATP-grasp superfamily ATP-dependent carboligase
MASYTQLIDRSFDQRVLVMCLEGWVDAGIGAATAVATIMGTRSSERIGVWDADEFIDHRARRPVLHLVEGVANGISWPEIEIRATADDAGRDMLMLIGPEPDMRWHAFAASVVDVASSFGVRLVCGLGAFPAPVPHTRPVRLVATAPNAELAAEIGFVGGSIDVPAGIQAVLEGSLNDAGIPAVGLWARVPHYVISMPYPAASSALIEGLAAVGGLTLGSGDLQAGAARARSRIDELIANSAEHQAMVAQLEAQNDREVDVMGGGMLPSGDEIAAELERYLRGDGAI